MKAFAFVLAGSLALALLKSPPSAAASGPQPGSVAPNFVYRTIDGARGSIADYRGRTLVLNVWATWCPPCRRETPDLAALSRALGTRDVAFLGVDTSEAAPIVRAFVASKGLTYPQVVDLSHAFERAYDITAYPTTYVIDPKGIIRARYLDIASAAILRTLITAAEHEKTPVIESAEQHRVDASLTYAANAFEGPRAVVYPRIQRAVAAIDAAAEGVAETSAQIQAVDDLRSNAECDALRRRLIAALRRVGRTTADHALLERLRGDVAAASEDWASAIAAYDRALAIDPKNGATLDHLSLAANLSHDTALRTATDLRLLRLDPSDPGAQLSVALDYSRAHEAAPARAAARKAIALAAHALAAHPGSTSALRALGLMHLYAGRIASLAGDAASARTEFAQVTGIAGRLPANDKRHDMLLEEAQEATLALDLRPTPERGATISLAPWTGPELPGSIPRTIKYRLVVAGTAGEAIALRAGPVPPGWIASFCSDRICSPFKTHVALPASGIKVVEFQLVPGDAPRPKLVTVYASGGGTTNSATL